MTKTERLSEARGRATRFLQDVRSRVSLDGALDHVANVVRKAGGSTNADKLGAALLPATSVDPSAGRRLLHALADVAALEGKFHVSGDQVRIGAPGDEPERPSKPKPEPVTHHPRLEKSDHEWADDPEMKAWLDFHVYGRVSTWKQAEGDSLDAQRDAARKYVERHRRRIASESMDVGRGNRLRRPGLLAALALVEAGKVGGIIVSKVDRLVRAVVHLEEILRRLDAVGAILVAVEDQADSRTSEGRARLLNLARQAQEESERSSQRIRASMRYKRERGLSTNGRAPYGSTLAGEQLADNLREQATIAHVRQLRGEGRSLRRVARELATMGVLSRRGRPFEATQVARMLAH